MELSSGARLQHYEVLAPIGSGGFGEVYRALDRRLEREVALKILPDKLSSQERLDRFEREAKLLAALNHPNVAVLHGLENADGRRFLVMELVSGETLADRLKSGPIPWDEARRIFCQIASGVAAAHAKGIIHRDLKPANVKLTAEGVPKVLDFGLAKAFGATLSSSTDSSSPTITRQGSDSGVLLGTAAYMSPEQAHGKPLDKRTDVWAFGCCLYEALTGKMLFLGGSVTETLANVLKQEIDWDALPKETPFGVKQVLRRCLQRDLDQRFRDMDDVRVELEEPDVVAVEEKPSRRPKGFLGAVGVASAIVGAIVASLLLWPERPQPRAARHFHVADIGGGDLQATHDGREILYISSLFVHAQPLDGLESRALAGTDGARDFFLSPDGEWLGFVTRSGEVKRTRLDGGLPTSVAKLPVPEKAVRAIDPSAGGTWASDGTIYVGTQEDALYVATRDGGSFAPLTKLGPEEIGHRFPEALPHGKHVLFTAWRGTTETSSIDVVSTETGERRKLLDGATRPIVSPSGHLLFARGTQLFAAAFDLDRAEIVGPEVGLFENVLKNSLGINEGDFSVSLSHGGTLIYETEKPGLPVGELLLVDRKGQARPLLEEKRFFDHPRVSPSGSHVAVAVVDERSIHPTDPIDVDVWIVDVERSTMNRLTFEGKNGLPQWSPDGTHLVVASDRSTPGIMNAVTVPLDVGESRQLTSGKQFMLPLHWAPSGEILLWTMGPNFDDILRVDPEGGEPQVLFGEAYRENGATLSPDGRVLAYTASELGDPEVYICWYPSLRGKTMVSKGRGWGPRFRGDGRELYYRREGKMYAVSIRTEPTLAADPPELLFELEPKEDERHQDRAGGNYDVMSDGRHFVMLSTEGEPDDDDRYATHIVVDFFEELNRRVPRNR